MRQEFSTSWLSSRQPRKQRKFTHNAPLHARRRFLSAHLSDALQEKHNMRSLPVRKGDEVVIMRGESKKKTGKVSAVSLSTGKVFIESMTRSKRDGSKVLLPFHPSNLQIISLADDSKRFAAAAKSQKTEAKKEEKKAEIKSHSEKPAKKAASKEK